MKWTIIGFALRVSVVMGMLQADGARAALLLASRTSACRLRSVVAPGFLGGLLGRTQLSTKHRAALQHRLDTTFLCTQKTDTTTSLVRAARGDAEIGAVAGALGVALYKGSEPWRRLLNLNHVGIVEILDAFAHTLTPVVKGALCGGLAGVSTVWPVSLTARAFVFGMRYVASGQLQEQKKDIRCACNFCRRKQERYAPKREAFLLSFPLKHSAVVWARS